MQNKPKMIQQIIVFIFFNLIVIFNAYGQTQNIFQNGIYIIDERIKKQVDEKLRTIKTDGFSTMDYQVYHNDSLNFDSGNEKEVTLSRTFALYNNDTIKIYSGLRDYMNFGFQIDLFRDTYIIKFFTGSNDKIYKHNQLDSLTNKIFVGCRSYKLTLAKKPEFKKNKIIEGKIELTSDEYYVFINDKEKKCFVKITSYFKTRIYNDINDYYPSLKQ